jgi:hypothetical protein
MGNPAQQSQKGSPQQPTGTSGRQGGDLHTGTDNDSRHADPAPARRPRVDEDEDSPLGNRTTNR